MNDEGQHVSVSEIEELIKKLPTVLGCAVAVTDWGAIEEVHVLTTLERSPKQIVRDVESALVARWGLRVDHKRISVAQIEHEDGQHSLTPLDRLIVAEYHVELDTVKGIVDANVAIHWSKDPEELFRGQWTGRYVPSQYYQVTAWATVEAVNQIPQVVRPFVLSDLKTLTLAGRTVVAVAVSRYDDRQREEVLVGTAPDRGDGQGASVRAVLNAVNRRLGAPEPVRRW